MTKAFSLSLLFSFCFVLQVWAQLRPIFESESNLPLIKATSTEIEAIKDSARVVLKLNKLLQRLQEDGYLLSGYKLDKEDTLLKITLEVGNQFLWANLKTGNLSELLLAKTGYRQRFFSNRPFDIAETHRLLQKIVSVYENEGYPFASVTLDSVTIIDQAINASLKVVSGPLITFDHLKVENYNKVKPKWLEAYLGIKYDEKFNQSIVSKITDNLDQLAFLSLDQSPVVTFQNERAEITLYLKEEMANSFDAIIGFLPNETEGQSILITGQLYLDLHNVFSTGKYIHIDWQSIKPRSQQLDMIYAHPNILKSSVGLEANFGLLKEDTFFINRQTEIAAYYPKSQNTYSLFFRNAVTSVLNNESATNQLSDVSTSYYGGKWQFINYTARQLKRKGMGLYLESAVGSKSISKDPLKPEEFYSDIELKSIQYLISGKFENYIALSKKLVFYQKLNGSKIFNDQVFFNDLFRIGGLKTIRGFNENFFFASEFLINNLELQLHFQDNSYLYLFYDQGYLYQRTISSRLEDYPRGIGLGLVLKINAANLSLAYALGQSDEQPFSFNLAKFHFGYIARF